MAFSPEQLFFFKLVAILIHLKEVVQSWKRKSNHSKTSQDIDSAKVVGDTSPTRNEVREGLCNGTCESCQERNLTGLFEAFPKEKVNDDESLLELPVEATADGKLYDSVQTPSKSLDERVDMAERQVYLLREKVCFEVKAEMIEKNTFDFCIERTKHVLDALEEDTSRIDNIVEMGEEDFPTKKVNLLRKKLDIERSCAKQLKEDNHFLNKVKSEDDFSNSQCTDRELKVPKKSLLSLSSEASSLNSVSSSPCDETRAIPEHSSRWSSSAFEEKAIKLKENTYQEGYASAMPLFDSSTKLQAEFHGKSSNEGGLTSREDHDTETVVVEHSIQQKDQEFIQSRQPNCICACCQSKNIVVSQLQDKIMDLLCKVDELQDETAFYQDRCCRQEDKITRLKENLSQIKEEKQGLEAEVGRQLFLEGKNKRYNRIYQSVTEHGGEQAISNTARGASFDVDGEELRTAGCSDDSGHLLQYITEEISDLLSKSEIERIKNLVTPIVDLDRLARIRKGSELFKELEYKGELSCSYVKCLLEKIHRSDLAEKLVAPFHNSDELFKREFYSPQERNQGYEASERTCVVDSRTSDEVEESGEISESADIDEEFHVGNPSGGNFCDSDSSTGSSSDPGNPDSLSSLVDINYADSSSGRFGLASSCSQSTSSSAVYVESLTEDSHRGTPTISLNSDHHGLKVWENSGESTFDTTSGGDEKQERSLSLSLTYESFESGEVKEWGAAKVEGGKKDPNSSSSICDGAVNGSYLVQHCNTVDVVDGPGCTSNRTQDSFKLKNVSGLNQDSLSPESMPQKQNVSHAMISAQKGAVHVLSDSCASNQFNTWEHIGARPKNATQMQNVSYTRITPQKDSAVDQADSYLSNQSHEWEHLGARPRDRTPKKDSISDSSSLFSSLVDLVPQQVGGPVVQGVVNAFLARHSEDKHLHESLYYNNAEEMLAKDMDSMMNMIDPNKAKPYLGDCQVATRSDPFSQPYSPGFPLTNEVYTRANGEDGFPLNDTFNGNYLLPPGPSYSCIAANTSQNSYLNSFNPNFLGGDFAYDAREPQLLQDGHFTSLQRSDFLQSGFTGSGLTSAFPGTTGPQMTHSVIGTQSNFGFTGTASILPPEPLQIQRSSTTNLELLASQNYGNQPNASTDFPTSSPMARANGSDSKLLSGLESGRNTHLSPVSSTGDRVNTSGQTNSNSISNTVGDCLASGTFREGNSADASSSSGSTFGANTGGDHDQGFGQSGGSVSNGNYGTESVESTDNSLLELEQRVEEACAMVERVLREREEREQFGREIERKEREIRAERARKKREREARELEEARGWPQQQEPVTGQSLWLCEHYQRHCRVRFPCCTNFYSCHRCHNNSKECDNEEAKASHATHLKCSYCHHEQEIAEDSAKCRSCGAKMSAYFCGICKHFTSIDKNPYHCDKCGICRIHKDKSFHCDVCNVCLDKRLQGKHKCRPDSGHDECCICLEDAFSGCQILPCSHKVHRECAIAMIQNGIRTCPVCRHPLYSPAPE